MFYLFSHYYNIMQIGRFTRTSYDSCYLPDRNQESTQPCNYQLNSNKIHNCNRCLSTLGPRSNVMGHGVSTTSQTGYAEAQDLIDIDSLMSNRNVRYTRCKKGGVNPVNLKKYKLYDTQQCNNALNTQSTRLSHPPSNYRDTGINRFYNLHHNPQENIFQPFSVNTHLETIDNWNPVVPKLWDENTLPREVQGKPQKCGVVCNRQ
jgi:hypothetical protein